jgi:hypothetical protein
MAEANNEVKVPKVMWVSGGVFKYNEISWKFNDFKAI